jgi:hypothetical protein
LSCWWSLQNNTGVGLNIDAEGNTWRANTQAAGVDGRYVTPATLAGPLETGNGNNFSINSGWSLRR